VPVLRGRAWRDRLTEAQPAGPVRPVLESRPSLRPLRARPGHSRDC